MIAPAPRLCALSLSLLLGFSPALARAQSAPEAPATPAAAEPATEPAAADTLSPSESGASIGDALAESLATCRLDDTLLDANVQAVLVERGLLVTSRTIQPQGLTEPSLWWARQQLREEKLVLDWLALPGAGRVEVLVNRQLWRSLDYLERYSFVNRFGTVAREYGYELRVFNPEPECVALYNCPFVEVQPRCAVDLQPPLRDIFSL